MSLTRKYTTLEPIYIEFRHTIEGRNPQNPCKGLNYRGIFYRNVFVPTYFKNNLKILSDFLLTRFCKKKKIPQSPLRKIFYYIPLTGFYCRVLTKKLSTGYPHSYPQYAIIESQQGLKVSYKKGDF